MRWYECFCNNDVDITEGVNVWTLTPQATIRKLEKELPEPEGTENFLYIQKHYKEPAMETVFCPFCSGLTIDELRGNRFAIMYHLPQKNYDPLPLAAPEKLAEFQCTCGKIVDTRNLRNQWMLLPEEEPFLDPVVEVFEAHGAPADYYRELYTVSKRAVTCPHCLGVTVAECDAAGNGLRGTYYAKIKETLGDEFDLSELDY